MYAADRFHRVYFDKICTTLLLPTTFHFTLPSLPSWLFPHPHHYMAMTKKNSLTEPGNLTRSTAAYKLMVMGRAHEALSKVQDEEISAIANMLAARYLVTYCSTSNIAVLGAGVQCVNDILHVLLYIRTFPLLYVTCLQRILFVGGSFLSPHVLRYAAMNCRALSAWCIAKNDSY